MLVHLDTSVLVDAFTAPRRSFRSIEDAVAAGHVLTFSTIVLYEWLRGPRTIEELSIVDHHFDARRLVEFGDEHARIAARLYSGLARARSRQADIAIAACAIERQAALWTLNTAHFSDIPGLTLYSASNS